MDEASSFFNKFLACVFTSIFALFFLVIVCIFLFRNMFTYDNVFKYVSDARVFDSESYEILSNGSSKTLRDSIHKGLLNIGIPESVTDDVLDSNEVSVALSNYIYGYYNYVLYDTEKVSFDEDKVILVVQNKYLINQGKSLSDIQLEQLKHYLNILTSKLDNGLFSDSELNEFLNLNVVRVIASALTSNYVVLLIVILIILMFVLISIYLQSLLKAYRWCSKMICLDGIILVITSLLEVKIFSMFFNSKGIVDNLVVSVVENGFTGLLICGIVLVVVGVILIAISGFLLFKKSNKSSDDKPSNMINLEVEKDSNDVENIKLDENNDVAEENDDVLKEMLPSNDEDNKELDKVDIDKDDSKAEESSIDDNENSDNAVESAADDSAVDTDSFSKDDDEDNKDTTESVKEYDTEIVEDSDVDIDIQDDDNVVENVTSDIVEIESVSDSSDMEENSAEDDEETQYTEISDNNFKEDEIDKKVIELEPLAEINPDVVYPEKGEDIKVNLEETEEEEIEIL